MRVSTNYQYQLYQAAIDQTTTSYVNAQQAVSTGKRINQLSDDPYGAVTAVSMSSLQAQLQQYASNITSANDYLNTTESASSQLGTLLNQAYSLAVQGANSTNDHTALNAIASQISDLQNQLVSIGNTQNSTGQYIFAGQSSNTKPFSAANGKLAYAGDTNNISVAVGPNSQMVVNTPGSPLFTNLYNQLEQLKTNLKNGNLSAISGSDVANLKSSIANVAQLNGEVGAQIQETATLSSDNTRRQTELTTNISNIEDVNISQAVIQLTQAQNAYQAAIETAGQLSKYNLLSFIG